MASLSRKARLQRYSWPLLEGLAFCSERYLRLAELAAQVLFEQQQHSRRHRLFRRWRHSSPSEFSP